MIKTRPGILLVAFTFALASPAILVGAILLELAFFRTRYLSDAAESVGLTNFLMHIFNFFGVNG